MAQAEDEISLEDIENFLQENTYKTKREVRKVKKKRKKITKKKKKAAQQKTVQKPQKESKQNASVREKQDEVFEDVAVLQKKYFPKTDRWELFIGGSTLLNDAFFLNGGLVGRVGYFFNESWGVEGTVLALTSGDRKVTRGLEDQGIVTTSLVTPELYYGVDAKWSPIYGKMAFYDESIVHYDLYFTVGLGMTKTNQVGNSSSEPTLHLGTGQNFAINRWMSFRWDFSWHFFNVDSVSGTASNTSGTIDNLFLTLGMSFFLPEATYR